jgi:hypothetical protein
MVFIETRAATKRPRAAPAASVSTTTSVSRYPRRRTAGDYRHRREHTDKTAGKAASTGGGKGWGSNRQDRHSAGSSRASSADRWDHTMDSNEASRSES